MNDFRPRVPVRDASGYDTARAHVAKSPGRDVAGGAGARLGKRNGFGRAGAGPVVRPDAPTANDEPLQFRFSMPPLK